MNEVSIGAMGNIAHELPVGLRAAASVIDSGSDVATGWIAAHRYRKGQMQAGAQPALDVAKEWNDKPGPRVIGAQGNRAVVTAPTWQPE
jgi:hypothetical protein